MVKTRAWFEKHITDGGRPYFLDKNQAKIVEDTHKNTLVTARAGSGKTRTIVAKIAYLLAFSGAKPEEIIVFSFNRKAKAEVNERLTQIAFDGTALFSKTPEIATTFHAFAYKTLGGREEIGDKLVTEEQENLLLKNVPSEARQFITRAEQKYFQDYGELLRKISKLENEELRTTLSQFYAYLEQYHQKLQEKGLMNFNQMMALSAEKLQGQTTPYKYIFVDEYQDFSLLFLEQIRALRQTCPEAKLLAVGDDWQAINRFAGSDVKYFLQFEKYFPDDAKKLFIPSNYRSNKKIVKNANFFMSTALGDFNGCKAGNKKLKGKICVKDVNGAKGNYTAEARASSKKDRELPLLLRHYFEFVAQVIQENPGKSVKILHRNNDLSFRGWSLERFCQEIQEKLGLKDGVISYSTIHRSKGLEADVVVLLEIDAEKFPGKDKTGGLFQVFGDDEKTLFEDEARLFYVALTRPKEKLYIITKTPRYTKENKKYNFLSYLNEEWLEKI